MLPPKILPNSAFKFKPNLVSLFLGFESDSDSSHLTRPSQLTAPGAGERAHALRAVGSSSDGPRLPDAASTRSRASPWMKIGRLAVVAFLSLARRNARACVSDAMAGEWVELSAGSPRNGSSHLMPPGSPARSSSTCSHLLSGQGASVDPSSPRMLLAAPPCSPGYLSPRPPP